VSACITPTSPTSPMEPGAERSISSANSTATTVREPAIGNKVASASFHHCAISYSLTRVRAQAGGVAERTPPRRMKITANFGEVCDESLFKGGAGRRRMELEL
jgi:hypothetical protein